MKIRIIAVIVAALFTLPLLCGTAFADDSVEDDPTLSIINSQLSTATDWPGLEQVPPLAPAEYPSPQPFTPPGTGTVIDNATDKDGKEFYTIMTPDEHVFYLVIDRQRNTENVYFLNAVTVADLISLAVMPEIPWEELPWDEILTTQPANPDRPAQTTVPPADEPQEEGGNNTTMYILIIVIAVLAGGAGWYFKVYRPKQQGAGSQDEYEPPADGDPDYDGQAEELPPWDGDGE